MIDLTSDDALRQLEVTTSQLLFLAFFYDEFPICRAMSNAYTALDLRFAGEIVTARVHAMQCPEAVKRFGIRNLPMHHLFAGGRILWHNVGGLSSADLIVKIDRALQEHCRAGD